VRFPGPLRPPPASQVLMDLDDGGFLNLINDSPLPPNRLGIQPSIMGMVKNGPPGHMSCCHRPHMGGHLGKLSTLGKASYFVLAVGLGGD
jgi:hypothetical protein